MDKPNKAAKASKPKIQNERARDRFVIDRNNITWVQNTSGSPARVPSAVATPRKSN